MSREILFRGKRVDNGEWVEGYYCGKVNKTFFSPAEDSAQIIDKDLWWHEVIPETVGQFTGLYANGKKIFEGDIIKCSIIYEFGCYPYTKTEIREVKYVEGCFVPFYNTEQNFYEVIGNIHDNPELM